MSEKELETEEQKLTEEEVTCDCSRVLPLDNYATDYDMDEFNKGVVEASYWAGFFVTLVDAGLSPTDAFQMMSNKAVLDHEERIADKNNQTALQISAMKADEMDV